MQIKSPFYYCLTIFFFAQLSLSVKQAKSQEKAKPNIVLIIVDQFRADARKIEGFELNTTPFLDSLSQTGAWFNKAYCASPACIPSRTSMMTGRFPNATHVRSNMNLKDAYFKKDLYQVLRDAGYSTGLIGKNHTYLQPDMMDYWKEYTHLNVIKPENEEEKKFEKFLRNTNFYMEAGPAPFPASMQQPARMVKDAEKWVGGLKDEKPFFLYLSFPEPHNPYQVSEPYYSMFPPESLPPIKAGAEFLADKGNKWVLQKKMEQMGYPDFEKNIPRIRSNYYGMMRLIDDEIKNFVNYLKQEKKYENTVFIFVSDHGDFTGEFGLIKKGVEVPESLIKIPMLWHGPRINPERLAKLDHVSNVDIMPTICDMLNIEFPDGVQGRSLWPILAGLSYPKEEFSSMIIQQGYGGLHYTDLKEYDPYTQDGTLVKGKVEFDELNTWTQSGMMRGLRKGDWKLVYDMQGSGQLYNLVKDPQETKNLFNDKEHIYVQMDLLKDMMRWELRVQDPLPLPRASGIRKYGYKKDSRNYYSPYKDEPKEKLKVNKEGRIK